MTAQTLAERYRPTSFADMLGNPGLVSADGVLTRMATSGHVSSCVLWGPPGCGKTTAARILADSCGLGWEAQNGTEATTATLKAAIERSHERRLLLYLDEIQFLNRRQQQLLLPATESGDLVLVASTTESPWHDVVSALLSRCLVLEFRPVPVSEVATRVAKVASEEGIALADGVAAAIAGASSGDVRRALGLLEAAATPSRPVTVADVSHVAPSVTLTDADASGKVHYRLLAALQKSVRGSDPDAAALYAVRLVDMGDLAGAARRLVVCASEDVGLADPDALPRTLACVEAAERLGPPEARKQMAQAAIYLACAPKSNSIELAVNVIEDALSHGLGQTVPPWIASECPPGYLYPHDYPNHWVPQQYLPDDLVGTRFWVPQDSQVELYLRSLLEERRNRQ